MVKSERSRRSESWSIQGLGPSGNAVRNWAGKHCGEALPESRIIHLQKDKPCLLSSHQMVSCLSERLPDTVLLLLFSCIMEETLDVVQWKGFRTTDRFNQIPSVNLDRSANRRRSRRVSYSEVHTMLGHRIKSQPRSPSPFVCSWSRWKLIIIGPPKHRACPHQRLWTTCGLDEPGFVLAVGQHMTLDQMASQLCKGSTTNWSEEAGRTT